MPNPKFRVDPPALNLRTQPVVAAQTRLAVLPQGHEVEKLEVASDPEWWRVGTLLGGVALEGFVAHRRLVPVALHVPPPAANGPGPVHLRENRSDVTRQRDGGRAFPLGEPGRPARAGASAEEKAASLGAVIEWLGVDDPTHSRYARQGSTTFCNVYAYDYCYLGGVYLPRVWWTGPALVRLGAGDAVQPLYAETVEELNANRLLDWLIGFGPTFGWQRVFDAAELQDAANAGEVCVICAQRVQSGSPGHISAVVPETAVLHATRNSQSTKPLQSQAGWNNFRYGTPRWWTDQKFRDFGFFRHA